VKVYADRTSPAPIKVVSRAEARRMKLAGEAYFCNHGRDLCLNAAKRPAHKTEEDEHGSLGNWKTLHESRLPINLQKRLAVSCLHITTRQYVTPKPSRKNGIHDPEPEGV